MKGKSRKMAPNHVVDFYFFKPILSQTQFVSRNLCLGSSYPQYK
jgi:hypothetical protein